MERGKSQRTRACSRSSNEGSSVASKGGLVAARRGGREEDQIAKRLGSVEGVGDGTTPVARRSAERLLEHWGRARNRKSAASLRSVPPPVQNLWEESLSRKSMGGKEGPRTKRGRRRNLSNYPALRGKR